MRARAAATLLVLALAAACVPAEASTTIEVTIRHSRFVPAVIDVRAGRPVTIVIRNLDPIDHEWIVGTPDVHERHRTGTEPTHDERPTEVSVPALETRITRVTFEGPGVYQVICHLPRHEAYGMVGIIRAR